MATPPEFILRFDPSTGYLRCLLEETRVWEIRAAKIRLVAEYTTDHRRWLVNPFVLVPMVSIVRNLLP